MQKNYLIFHPPFPVIDVLLFICSEIVGGQDIDCRTAITLKNEEVVKIIGERLKKITFKLKGKVLTLASFNSSVKVAKKEWTLIP